MSTYQARKTALKNNALSPRKLLATSALTAAGLLALGITPANANNWGDLTTTSGNTTTDTSRLNNTDITLNTQRAVMEGDLDIDAGHSVNVGRGDLVAIDREADPTFIFGSLNCAGSCHVMDGNGVIVGDTGSVDATSVSLSDGEILNRSEFMNGGNLEIGNFSGEGVTNNGTITVSDAGIAAILSPRVSNNGVISAKMGTVKLASAEKATLDLSGDGLFEVTVEGELADALIDNQGTIAAEGGRVHVTALAAKGAVDNVINMDGVVTVASATQKGGKIVLSGGSKGTVKVSGIVDASGTDGGDIEVTGENVHVTETAYLSVDGGKGTDGQGDGGSALVYGNKYAVLEGQISGRGGANGGDGGDAELSAGESVGFNGVVDLGADNGEVGTFVIDPAHLFINDTYSFLGFGFGPIDTLTVYDQAIANTLHNNDVKLWATETANTGSDINISEYDYDRLEVVGSTTIGFCPIFCVTVPVLGTVNYNGITGNDLTIAAPEVNIAHDVTLGTGALNISDILVSDSVLGFGLITPPNDIIVDELNLDGKIYKRTALADPSFTTLADDAQINTTADTINVSNGALIQQAIHFADASDADAENINLAAQTFTNPSQVVFDRDVNVTGAGKLDTIVNPGFDTGTSGDSRGWWLVESGTVLNLADLTMDGNGQLVWQGIRHKGSGTIDNVLFNDIQYNPSTNYQGTAVAAFGDGAVDITNSMFTNIGRIGVLYFGAGVAGSTFSGNMYTGKGAGDWLDYALDISNGATVTVSDNAISNNLGVASSDGSTSAGVLVTTFFGPGTAATFSGNTLTDNSTGLFVGFNSADSSAVTIGADNIITGGENGIVLVGADSDIVGDTLSNTVFGGQSDTFVGLYNGAEFAPGNPTVIDGTGVTWGTYGLLPTGADAIDVENMIDHFADTGADGLINFGAVVVNNNAGEETFDGSIQKGVNIAGLNSIDNVVVAGSGDTYGGSVEVWADDLKIEGVNYMTNDVTIDVATADAFSNIGDVNDGFVVADGGSVGDGSDVTGVNIDPIVFSGSGDGVVLGTGGSAAIDTTIDGNTFTVSGVGVKVNNVGGTTDIINNDIDTGSKAIQINENLDGDRLNIDSNTHLQGAADAIEFTKGVKNANVNISNNGDIIGDGSASFGDAIDFRGLVENSIVNINNNQNIHGNDDAIQVIGGIRGGSFSVTNNAEIRGKNGEGITLLDYSSFGGDDINSISDGANVKISGNTIVGTADGDSDNQGGTGDGILISGGVDNSKVGITYNNITGHDEGVNFNGKVTGGSEIGIVYNTKIEGTNGNGIEFNGIEDSTVIISYNTSIIGGEQGVLFAAGSPSVLRSTVDIMDNTILGALDGIHFADKIDDSTVKINDNTSITGTTDDGVDFNGNVENGSDIEINRNGKITGGSSNGVEFAVVKGASTVEIRGNEIDADDNGVFFTTATGGSTVDIHDNIIRANLDAQIFGSGIWFNQNVTDATINIGDGALNSNPSNIITTLANSGPGGQSDIDGIHFDKGVGSGAKILIDGNRIGTSRSAIADDGVEFKGAVNGDADIQITDNRMNVNDDGVQFTDMVSGMAHIIIGETPSDAGGNKIWAGDNGVSFLGQVKGQSLIEIVKNYINAQSDGVLFNKKVSNAKTTGGASGQEILISGNTIWGQNNGIHFAGIVEGSKHDTKITGNNIEGENGQGIVFDDTIDEAHIKIVENSRIEGQVDGVRFLGEVEDGARVDINDNTSIEGIDEEAIHFFDEIEEATVNIISNDNLRGGDHGIQFGGEIDESNITISANNHGIHADNHGILFNADVEDDSVINIHDNVIAANEDGGSIGDGIHFAGKIKDSDVNIGDGFGPSYFNNPSNIIKGVDGIHFAEDIEDGSRINIDGNRLGYYKTAGGSHVSAELEDDGIQFLGKIEDDSEIKITDNRINADDDGIYFGDDIEDDARILIGGHNDGNAIFADDDGIQFADKIENHSLLEISYNEIDADENGIQFDGSTSNHRHDGHPEEILIKKNKIEGGEHGIVFYGQANHSLHDIMIRDNYYIKGYGENGVTHVGNINDAELRVLDNDQIYGRYDGVHVKGYFYNDALIKIAGNGWDGGVRGRYDDGIHVQDTGFDTGADVYVTNNHVHYTGDDGIYVRNIEDVLIGWNEVHNTGGNGIYGSNIDGGDIFGNTIWNAGENGILVNPTDYVDIAYNNIHDVDEDGIKVEDGYYADIWDNHIGRTGDDGIHVDNNYGVDIWDNYIHDTGRYTSHGDGIYVNRSDYADIKYNDITGAGRDGIGLYSSYRADILFNDIFAQGGEWKYWGFDYGHKGAGRDGIHVEYSDKVDIIGNDIDADLGLYGYSHKGAGRHGIFVNRSDYADIKYNDIRGDNYYYWSVNSTGEDGIHVYDSYKVDIVKNDIDRTGENGIYGNMIDKADIYGNEIYKAGADGIKVKDSNYVDILWNKVYKSRYDGIDLEYSKGSDIKYNVVKFNGDNGIEASETLFTDIKGNFAKYNGNAGIMVDHSAFVDVAYNYVKGNVFGIKFDKVGFGNIERNYVKNNLIGVKLQNAHIIDVNENMIANNLVGLWAYGGRNGYINVRNNVFLDNPYHAKFNSGIIDLTHLDEGEDYSNQFIGGNVGLYFDAWRNKPWLLSLVKTGGISNGYTYDYLGYTPWVSWGDFIFNDSYTFDTFNGTGVFPPSEFGGTIGAQLFDGQSDYFVKLGSKTFVVPGESDFDTDSEVETALFDSFSRYKVRFPETFDAIWLDARDSTYVQDGVPFSPAAQGGIITPDQLAFLEEMFFHYPDVSDRGIFFFGLLPPEDLTIDNVEDFFREFDPFGGGFAGLNLTITGLPPVNLPPVALNNILPFAGGEDGADVAGIEPAAGGEDDGSSFADIEPAAGESAACWGDVLNAAINGPVNYNFSGDAGETLAAAASCGS